MNAEIDFTMTDQMIYDELIHCIHANEYQKVAVIAKRLEVAPSSIIKVAKKIGYSGWKEMFYSLSSSYTDTTQLYFDQSDFFEQEQLHVIIDKLANLLVACNQCIYVNTIGDVHYLDFYVLKGFWDRGFQAQLITLDTFRLNRRKDEGGVGFFINESGIVLLKQCMQARENDFTVISITANANSPVAVNSHITVELEGRKSSIDTYQCNFFTARVLIFLELLFVAIDEKSVSSF